MNLSPIYVLKLAGIYFFIAVFSFCTPGKKATSSYYDLSTPSKSLYTLAHVLQKKDTVQLKKITTAYGYGILFKEIGYQNFDRSAPLWIEACNSKRVSETIMDEQNASVTMLVISPSDTSKKAVVEMSFGKDNGKWKFGLFSRAE